MTAARESAGPSSGRPAERAAAHQVEMEVVDRLPAPRSDVRDNSVTLLGDALGFREGGGQLEDVTEQRAVISGQVRGRGMCSRQDEDVGARGAMSRMAIMVILVDLRRWDLACGDAAEMHSGPALAPLTARSPQEGLRAHQEPDAADQPGHHVGEERCPAAKWPTWPRRRKRGGREARSAGRCRRTRGQG